MNLELGISRRGRRRDREKQISREREMEYWRVLAMEWVVKLTVGIEHLIISITQDKWIKYNINQMGYE